MFRNGVMAALDSNRRDEQIARDDDGQPIPKHSNRADGPAKTVRRRETFHNREAAQARVDEINPKVLRGQSPAAQRDAGNRPLSRYAEAWLGGLAGRVKRRVLADYRTNYRRYVAEPLGESAVETVTAADVRRWRAELMQPRPRPAHTRPNGTTEAEAIE